MRDVFELFLLAVSTWRISSLLVNEPGPGDVFEKLRYKVGVRYDEYSKKTGTTVISSLFTCLWCMSVWVAFFLVIGEWMVGGRGKRILLYPLTLSGLAIWLDQEIGRKR